MVLLHRCFAKVKTTVQKRPREGWKISTKYFMGGGGVRISVFTSETLV